MVRTGRRPARTVLAAAALALVTSVGGPAAGTAAAAAPGPAASSEDLTVYVSATDGDDDNSGSRSAPLKTIAAARDALAGRTSAEARGTVYIRGGTYVLDDTIRLKGVANSWVTYAAYRNEKVTLTGSHELPADGWKKLTDLSDDTLAEPQYSSNTRLNTPELRDGVWVYDLGAHGIDPGTLYKNGFNWVQQPFAPELVVDGGTQTLAEYPNGNTCSTTETGCHLWGTGAKWKADGPQDLMNVDLDARFGPESAWNNSGTTPRAQFEDKKQLVPDPAQRSTWTPEEMRRMTPSIFAVGGRAATDGRYQRWAPEAVPTVDDPGTRGFGEYRDVPVQLDPRWIENIDNTKSETEGWLSGYLGNNYANDMLRILSWSGDKLYTKYPSMYIPQDSWTKVKVLNVLSEMDTAGEYYIDRYSDNDVLYYRPQGGTIEGKNTTLQTFDKNFMLLEDTRGVTVRGLAMTGSLISGVQLLDAVGTLIDGVDISNVSMDAIRIGRTTDTITSMPDYETVQGGHGNVVQNSYLHDLGGGGVLLGGGDRTTLERGDNVARHNEMTRFSRLATYTPAGYMYGVGNTFEYNYVHDAPHMAVQIMGNDMRVNHNHFYDVVKNAGDMGVIYAGRDFTYLGNEIAYNHFEKIGGSNDALYMDDGATGVRFHHNVVNDSKSGVNFNSGHSNTANDNVFIGVDHSGHGGIYHKNGETRLPLANSWVLESRYNAFLDVREGEKYSATPQTVAAWHEHYTNGKHKYSDGTPISYPEITEWYVPRVTETGEECTAAVYTTSGTNGCSRETVWEDPDSVWVPSRLEIDHAVIVGCCGFVETNATFGEPTSVYNLSRWSDRINTNSVLATSVADTGLDLATLKFSNSGSVAQSYGTSWVAEWNRGVTADGIGRPSRGDTGALWSTVDEAARVLADEPGDDAGPLTKAAAKATVAAEATDSSQERIDGAVAALKDAIEAYRDTRPSGVTVTGAHDMTVGQSLSLEVEVTPSGADQSVSWSSSDPAVATVSAGGSVKAVGAGRVVITATSDHEKTASGSATLTVNAWSATKTYGEGDVVFHDGRTYQALWYARGEKPGASATGAWAEIGAPVTCADGPARAWTSSAVYTSGAMVVHAGRLWTAKWWTRNQAPGDRSGPWKDKGACTAG
ncbi:Ig-like domain-containing protein [Streptomyces sp. NPDC058217]|uniref:Ig-like domain-containing protein n=1 Tax=Streptomyces sp. NPDC058217 TaxID=3346384 RepID=UPI0036F012BE